MAGFSGFKRLHEGRQAATYVIPMMKFRNSDAKPHDQDFRESRPI